MEDAIIVQITSSNTIEVCSSNGYVSDMALSSPLLYGRPWQCGHNIVIHPDWRGIQPDKDNAWNEQVLLIRFKGGDVKINLIAHI
ncbi:hypothetical protein RHGRI_023876 [Rhododendron griersonianum]|uniref:Uncharacterized protein n=1 Tax=Rhododendron griersonianum TaxID=479676 RepID=A0AAV6J513_9ERIC|nr:hypothetical protein RHGRI_023876 [Rhododendron griersonianum]